MSVKNKLFSKPLFRNIIDSFGGRSGYSRDDKVLVPYFQYKIGDYQSNYFLYFNKQPYHRLYTNEIFNKLNEYCGYDIIHYLEFHFENYNDKDDFLRFLSYEISERLKIVDKNRRLKLQSALDWVTEKQNELRQNFQREIEKNVYSILQEQPDKASADAESQINVLTEKLANYMEELMANAEKSMKAISQSFTTGNVQLNNRSHEDKLIQILILVQEITNSKSEQLFKKFSLSDIATILHLHFDAFKDKKLNTVQKNISKQTDVIHNSNSDKIKKLEAALSDFFY